MTSVPVHRRADAHARVEPAAGEDVDGGEVLGQPQRVLPAERDDRGPELDPAGALRRGRQHGDGRGDAVLQVPVPQPGAVEAEPLAELDDLQRRLVPGPGSASSNSPMVRNPSRRSGRRPPGSTRGHEPSAAGNGERLEPGFGHVQFRPRTDEPEHRHPGRREPVRQRLERAPVGAAPRPRRSAATLAVGSWPTTTRASDVVRRRGRELDDVVGVRGVELVEVADRHRRRGAARSPRCGAPWSPSSRASRSSRGPSPANQAPAACASRRPRPVSGRSSSGTP